MAETANMATASGSPLKLNPPVIVAKGDLVGQILQNSTNESSTEKPRTQEKAKGDILTAHKSDKAASSSKGKTESRSHSHSSESENKSKDENSSKNHKHHSHKHHKSDKSEKSRDKKHSSSRSSGDSKHKSELTEIKEQLKSLTSAMTKLTPVVTEMKAAYDEARNYQQETDFDSDVDVDGKDSELSDGELSDSEPPPKKHKPDPPLGPGLSDRSDVTCAAEPGSEDAVRNQNNKNGGAQKNCQTNLKTCDRFVVKKNVTSDKIDTALAEKISGYLMNGIDKNEKEITMKNALFLPPENCPRLDVILVNQGLFNKADRETRTGDVILQNFQKPLLKGMTILAKTLDKFIKAEVGEADPPSTEETKDLLSEAIAILGDTSHEIDLRRRVLFRPTIDPSLAQALCGDSAPVEGQLFGTNLSQRVTELKDINKVTNSVVKQNYSNAGKGQGHYHNKRSTQAAPRHHKFKNGRTGNPFLGPSHLPPHKKAGYQNNRGKQQAPRYQQKPQYPQKHHQQQTWY